MSLRSKMLAMSTIPVIVLVFAVIYAVSAQRTASRTNAEVDNANVVRQQLSEIQDDLAVAESSVRGFLLTAEPDMLASYGEAVRSTSAGPRGAGYQPRDETPTESLDRLKELVTERLATFRATLRIGVDRTPELQARLETQLLRGAELTRTRSESCSDRCGRRTTDTRESAPLRARLPSIGPTGSRSSRCLSPSSRR